MICDCWSYFNPLANLCIMSNRSAIRDGRPSFHKNTDTCTDLISPNSGSSRVYPCTTCFGKYDFTLVTSLTNKFIAEISELKTEENGHVDVQYFLCPQDWGYYFKGIENLWHDGCSSLKLISSQVHRKMPCILGIQKFDNAGNYSYINFFIIIGQIPSNLPCISNVQCTMTVAVVELWVVKTVAMGPKNDFEESMENCQQK